MPIYEYYCTKCEKSFEAYHTHVDDGMEQCEDCGEFSQRTQHYSEQKLRRPEWTRPPLATRKYGEAKPTAHRPAKWH